MIWVPHRVTFMYQLETVQAPGADAPAEDFKLLQEFNYMFDYYYYYYYHYYYYYYYYHY